MRTVILLLIYLVAYVIYLVLNILYAPLKAIEKSQALVSRIGGAA
jgi:hypothetical protein